MGKDNNRHSLLSTHTMCRLAESQDDYIIIPLDECRYTFNDNGLERMRRTLEMSGASFVYSDYIDNGEIQRLIPWQEGSLRDDFDFGKIVMVRSADLKKAVSGMDEEYEAAGWYALRLRLTRDKAPTYCPEPLYTIEKFDPESGSEENQFAYVDPRNRTSQIEMERAATRHLKAIKAYVSPKDKISVDVSQGAYPVEASVIIPVRNRHLTIADAVESALSQVTDFPFNIIVVDNRSDDGTSEILYRLEKRDPRVKVINTSGLPYPYIGIGGCWNIAVNSEYCGRFAIQLDSDDLYSGRDTLQKIVEKFRSEGCAMVIGSYTLTDFECNILPPGLIEGIEGVEELVLHLLLPRHKLHVVHQQQIRLPVLGPELAAPVGPDQLHELVDELVALDVDDFGGGVVFPDDVGDGVEQVGLSQAGVPVNEEGIVILGGVLRHGHGGGVGQLVGGAHHEILKGELRVGEPLGLALGRGGALKLHQPRVVQNLHLEVRGEKVVEGCLDVV